MKTIDIKIECRAIAFMDAVLLSLSFALVFLEGENETFTEFVLL